MQNLFQFTETADFLKKFDELNAAGEFFICYMTGGENAEGVNWCPDCVNAKPAITSKVLEVTKLPVIKGVVIDPSTWCGVSTHPYKTHAIIKAGGVPSVVLVQSNQVLMRAENPDDFANEELLGSIACPE